MVHRGDTEAQKRQGSGPRAPSPAPPTPGLSGLPDVWLSKQSFCPQPLARPHSTRYRSPGGTFLVTTSLALVFKTLKFSCPCCRGLGSSAFETEMQGFWKLSVPQRERGVRTCMSVWWRWWVGDGGPCFTNLASGLQGQAGKPIVLILCLES